MTLATIGDRVLVRRTEHELTDGGLVIPLTAQARKNLRGEYAAEGTVVAVGDGLRRPDGSCRPPDVRPGDRVFFPTWIGMTAVQIDGELHFSVEGDDLVAVLRDDVLRPLRHRALLVREAAETKIGSLVIPDVGGKRTYARVVEVGTGYAGPRRNLEGLALGPSRAYSGGDHALDCRPGDRVLIGEHGGTEIRIRGTQHFIGREEDILAAISDAA